MNFDDTHARIKERGYWEIVLRPTIYPEKLIAFDTLKKLMAKCQIRRRIWHYPHISRDDKFGGFYIKHNCVESWLYWTNFLEVFRFYQSGQFVMYKAMPEDRKDDIPASGERDQGIPEPIPEKRFIEPVLSLYSLIEIFLFASNLAREKIFGRNLLILIKVHNQKNRIIQSLNPARWWGDPGLKSHADTITIGDEIIDTDKLLLGHDKMAVDGTIKLLSYFNKDTEGLREVLDTDLANYYK